MLSFFKTIFKELGISYTTPQLKLYMEECPYIGSLFGIKVVLSKYNIGAEGIRFIDKREIKSSSTPLVVAYDQEFVLVTSIGENSIKLVSPRNGTSEIDYDLFESVWNGEALIISHNEYSHENNFRDHKKTVIVNRFKTIGIVFCCLSLIISLIISSPLKDSCLWWILLLSEISGMGISFLLLQEQLKIPNKLTTKICGVVSDSHCESVTESSGSNFFGIFTLSEIGSSYFLVNLICLLLFPSTVSAISFFSLCVLPLSLWSVWYQKFKAKAWCVLCLAVMLILWIQGITVMISGLFLWIPDSPVMLFFLSTAYGFSILIINKVMDSLSKYRDYRNIRNDYNMLRLKDEVIGAFENNANIFDVDPDTCSSIIFGNPQAENSITVFSNPYCSPCAIMHRRIKDMPGEAVSIRYVMTSFSEERLIINRYFIAAYYQLGPKKTWELMSEWFDKGKKDNERFFDGLGIDINRDAVWVELVKQRLWAEKSPLYGTPTVIVNGREVVWPYSVDDYCYMPKNDQ